jgi:hypothetical protein
MQGCLSQHAGPRDALAIGEQCHLSKDARRLLREDLSPDDYFDTVLANQLYADAVRFLAQTLPKRRAIWWGCLCALWHAHQGSPDETAEASLEAAVRWVLEPSEPNRRSAGAAGQADGFDTIAGCLAMSAFWSGGSMSRPDLPAVAPPAELTGRLVGGAILLAALRGDVFSIQERFRQCLALGLEVARGENLFAAEDRHEHDDEFEPEVQDRAGVEADSLSVHESLRGFAPGCGTLCTPGVAGYAESIDTNEATTTVF